MAKQAEHGISWTEQSWNPIRGCSRVSEGCRNCYAERIAHRFSGVGESYEGLVRIANGHPQWTGEVRVVEQHMLDPLHWKTPRRIFVNSMSDLFHDNVTDETLDRIFAVMALCPQHTFQVLTKRPARMLEYLSADNERYTARKVFNAAEKIDPENGYRFDVDIYWPLHNVWLGVSVENQAAADERIPLLLQTPAAVRWVSAEPLLGPVQLDDICYDRSESSSAFFNALDNEGMCEEDCAPIGTATLDWVVVDRAHSSCIGRAPCPLSPPLRDQCVAAGVAFHFKQWGEWLPAMCDGAPGDFQELNCSDSPVRVGKRKAGRLLDGRTWDEYPAVRA